MRLFILLLTVVGIIPSGICQEIKNERYRIEMNLTIPYALYVNNILVSSSVWKDHNTVREDISSFFVKGREQQIDLLLSCKTYSSSGFLFDWEEQEGVVQAIDEKGIVREVQKIEFPLDNRAQYRYVNSFSLDVEEISGINDLSESIDLSKEDPNKLKTEVEEFYEKLRLLLNNGDIEGITRVLDAPMQIQMNSELMSANEKVKYQQDVKDFLLLSKGALKELKADRKTQLLGYGKAIYLGIDSGKYYKYDVLSNIDVKGNLISSNYFILHKPIATGRLEVFRYVFKDYSSKD